MKVVINVDVLLICYDIYTIIHHHRSSSYHRYLLVFFFFLVLLLFFFWFFLFCLSLLQKFLWHTTKAQTNHRCSQPQYLRTASTAEQPAIGSAQIPGTYIRGILMHVASGLFSWSTAAGLLAFSSRQFAPTINNGSLSASHNISILPSWASVAGGKCRPRSEASCMYHQVPLCDVDALKYPGCRKLKRGAYYHQTSLLVFWLRVLVYSVIQYCIV